VFCGWIELIPLAEEGPEIEIGWRLPRSCWGQGLASEAARSILNHGFVCLRLEQIVGVIDPDNRRSKAVANRLGFRIGSEPTVSTSTFMSLRSANLQKRSLSHGMLIPEGSTPLWLALVPSLAPGGDPR